MGSGDVSSLFFSVESDDFACSQCKNQANKKNSCCPFGLALMSLGVWTHFFDWDDNVAHLVSSLDAACIQSNFISLKSEHLKCLVAIISANMSPVCLLLMFPFLIDLNFLSALIWKKLLCLINHNLFNVKKIYIYIKAQTSVLIKCGHSFAWYSVNYPIKEKFPWSRFSSCHLKWCLQIQIYRGWCKKPSKG